MNLIIITGSLYNNIGGPFLSVRSLVTAFLQQGFGVAVFGSKDNKSQSISPESYKPLSRKFEKLSVFALKKWGPYNLHFTPRLGQYLKNQKQVDFVLIQGIWQWNCWKAFFYGKKNKIPTIISIRGEFNDLQNINSLKKKLFLPWIKYMLNSVEVIHVLNHQEVLNLKKFGIKSRIEVIPNGVFLPEEANYQVTNKDVLFLGRLHPDKNIIPLINAWKSLKHKDCSLIFAGSGKPSFEKEMIELIGNDETIKLIGAVNEDQKKLLFPKVGWFILPSLKEGMPMAALEALSYGVPCILSKECNLNDVIDYGAALPTGLLQGEIADTLEIALKMNDDEKMRISKKGQLLMQKNYTWDSVVQKFKHLFSEIK